MNGWLWVVAHSVRDFTFPLMLGTGSNIVIAQLLWQYWQGGMAERASALAVVLICFLVLFVFSSILYKSTASILAVEFNEQIRHEIK